MLQAADILHHEKESKNGIVFYQGSVSKFTQGYYPYYPINGTDQFEQPELGTELIGDLLSQNPNCKDFKVQESVTLNDIYEQCKRNPLDGHRAFLTCLKALKEQRQVPVYVLFDNVNSLFTMTQYRDPKNELLPVKRMPLLQALSDLVLKPTRSLTAIGAMTWSDPLLKRAVLPDPTNLTNTLNRQPCTMYVPDMSKQEAGAFLDNLHTPLSYISPTVQVDRTFIEHKHFMTGGNSRLLFESAMYDDLYN